MLSPPLTRKQAEKQTYGHYRPRLFRAEKCAWELYTDYGQQQCSRAPGHGPDGLYCRQHARMVERHVAK